MYVQVKICGITSPGDAEMAIDAGADLIGLNFVPSSKRYVSAQRAAQIVVAVAGRVQSVGVVADLSLAELLVLRAETGIDALQLHGSEPPSLLDQLPPVDFKAVRIGGIADVNLARSYRGPRLLVDAKVGDELGGTGHRFDWSLISGLAEQRDLIVAGGLNPENVAQAVRQLKPWGVDVASGVERSGPGKDLTLVHDFVTAVRDACTRTSD